MHLCQACALTISGCELIFNKPVGEVSASDHFGLITDIGPPPGA